MKNITIIIILFIAVSCSSKPETDSALLKKDKADLEESLQSYKVTLYKFVKIVLRSSVATDTISPEYQEVKTELDEIFNLVMQIDAKDKKKLSLLDYSNIYGNYIKMEDYIAQTDEDIFPTVQEVFGVVYTDSLQIDKPFSTGTQKEYSQNIEHTLLSALVLLSKDMGKEISLYECSKIKPDLFPDIELNGLSAFYRGFLYFEKGFYYLSEDEFTRNIAWINGHPEVEQTYMKTIFQLDQLSNEEANIAFRSLNYLFRGFDRLVMDSEIDKQKALEDFEQFLKDSEEVGVDNEMIWAVETFMYLSNSEKEKAITSLTKLKSSKLLSYSDKKRIDESITYIKKRESGDLLNGMHDKFFLGKVASKYVLSVLQEVDWKKVLEEENVPHTKEMFETYDEFNEFIKIIDIILSRKKLQEFSRDVFGE